jgi:hypothetical protein
MSKLKIKDIEKEEHGKVKGYRLRPFALNLAADG